MKKFKTLSILLILSAVLFTPLVISAQEHVPNCCKLSRTFTLDGETYEKNQWVGGEDTCNQNNDSSLSGKYKTNNWGLLCFLSSTYVITDWIFTILIAFVMILVVIGAFRILTSAGDPEKVRKGRNYILYAAIGLAVALLAKAIPALVQSLLA